MNGVTSVLEVEVMKIIRIKCTRGNGTKSNPHRYITQYWDLEGNLLAINDPDDPAVSDY